MQTTLLTIAVAIILVVVAALAAPFFVDWNAYRAVFESEAGRLTGLQIKVGGDIEARLLPAPRLQLQNVAIGGAADPLRARSLTIEFALAPLMRGEWRAAELRLVGPEVKFAVNSQGQLSGPTIAIDFDPDAISIERLGIEDGKLLIDDASRGGAYTLEKIWFNGELRSLLGPLRGEGAFTVGGELYPYRISSGRLGEGNALRLHLNIDPVNLPFNVESDGTLTFAAKPQFDGTLNISRPVGIAPRGTGSLVTQPWRLSSKLKVSPASALMQDAEFSYGSDPNAVKLTGTAELKFGARPRFDGVLSARQVDLDRLSGEGDAANRSPPAVSLKRLAAWTGQAFQPPFPVQIGLGVDQVTLGGADIYGLRGDLSTAANGWTLDRFEFRAPGFTQVRLSGGVAVTSSGARFTGPAEIAANDPQALTAWLEGRADTSRVPPRPLKLRGDLTVGPEKLAIERLNANFERGSVTGNFVYSFATRDQGPRVDASLNAPELDVDAASAFTRALLAGSALEAPSEASLAIDIGRATFAGFDAGKTSARLDYGKSGVRIERLSIDNLGGANIAASGQIALTPVPRGNVTVDLNARELAGINGLIGRFSPDVASRLRAVAPSLAPAKLRANFKIEDAAPGNRATLAVDGTAGALRVNLEGQAGLNRVSLDDLPAGAANIRLRGRLDGDNTQVLAALFGLDRYIAVGKEPGNLTVSATGAALGQLQVDARLTGSGVDAGATGSVAYTPGGLPQGTARFTVTRADFAPLRGGGALPASGKGRLTFTPDKIAVEELNASVAGATVRGKLAVGLGTERSLSGELEADSLDTAALGAAAIGTPPGTTMWNWPAEPFADSLPSNISGSVSVRATRAVLPPNMAARELRANLRVARDEIVLDDISAVVAGGRLTGSIGFSEAPEGLAMRTKLALANADVTAFLPAAPRPAITGRLTLNTELEGSGRSPQALIGSLQGGGKIKLTNAEIAGLDPRAFTTVTRAVDQGLPIEKPRIESLANNALASGRLAVREIESDLAVNAGQVRLANVQAKGDGADVSITGALDLTIGTLDARLILTGTEQAAGARPDIFLSLRGALAAPERNVDISALTSWLTLRSVEQQSKKLEKIESVPAPTDTPPPVPEAPKAEHPAPKAEAPAPKPHRPVAPALPPPIDIRPILRAPPSIRP